MKRIDLISGWLFIVLVSASYAQELIVPASRARVEVSVATENFHLDCWKPGAFDSKTNIYPYDQALARTSVAKQSGVLKGIIWHQGESNSNPERGLDPPGCPLGTPPGKRVRGGISKHDRANSYGS